MSAQKQYKDFYTTESHVYEATRYGTRYGTLFRQLHYRVLGDILTRLPKNLVVLEVACGTGHVSRLLNSLEISTIACDLTPKMMLQARQSIHHQKAQTTFLQTNAFHLPFSDHCIDVLVSTRFLHLFNPHQQLLLLQEYHRVLKSGGTLIVDFDSFTSRWFFALPHILYNIFRYRRIAPDSNYNTVRQTRALFKKAGFTAENIQGVGGWHLLLFTYLPSTIAYSIGLLHRYAPLRFFAEQFVVVGKLINSDRSDPGVPGQ